MNGPNKRRSYPNRSSLFRSAAFVIIAFCGFIPLAKAIGQDSYIETSRGKGDFALIDAPSGITIFVDAGDFSGVARAAAGLKADIQRVTGDLPAVIRDSGRLPARVILIGTLGKSDIIDQLVQNHKLDVSAIAGKWESFDVQVVEDPLPGVSSALVITGSDKRGTIYGIYDLSEQIGVSPWYWWADVPVRHQDALFVKPGAHVQGPPKVKYRGIFLNDEAPSLTGWVNAKYGGYNHEFYEKVFELLLRLKGKLSLAGHVEQRFQRRRCAEFQTCR